MTVIASSQYTQFFRSLPATQQQLAQGMYNELDNDVRKTLKASAVVELLDGLAGSRLSPATAPFDVRVTVPGVPGEIVIGQTSVTSTLQVQG
jgi:hypothetical protein